MNLEQQAQTVSDLLKTLGNPTRLLILCILAERGEMCVTHLHAHLPTSLSQPALSQHLAKMRSEGILTHRQDTQKMYYKISDDKTLRLMQALHDIFCANHGENDEYTNH